MNLHTSSENWTENRGAETRLAIVGIGCRFPGNVDRPEKYLDLLRNQTCAISEATDGRWNSDHFFSSEPDVPQRSVTKWAGFVPDITKFDADHFGISPREAEAMDPQTTVVAEGDLGSLRGRRHCARSIGRIQYRCLCPASA